MKKLLSILLVSGVMILVCNGQNKPDSITKINNDPTELKLNLKGKIKTLTETGHEADFGKYIYSFNDKGKMIAWEYYDPQGGVLDSKHTFKYNEKGNKIEENEYSSTNGKIDFKHSFKYDNNGNMTEDIRYFSGDSTGVKDTYKYDDKGNMIEKDRYNTGKKLLSKEIYKYDEKGNVIVYKKFWQNEEENDNFVPPLLVYADLINSDDSRCQETGVMVYKKFLQNNF